MEYPSSIIKEIEGNKYVTWLSASGAMGSFAVDKNLSVDEICDVFNMPFENERDSEVLINFCARYHQNGQRNLPVECISFSCKKGSSVVHKNCYPIQTIFCGDVIIRNAQEITVESISWDEKHEQWIITYKNGGGFCGFVCKDLTSIEKVETTPIIMRKDAETIEKVQMHASQTRQSQCNWCDLENDLKKGKGLYNMSCLLHGRKKGYVSDIQIGDTCENCTECSSTHIYTIPGVPNRIKVQMGIMPNDSTHVFCPFCAMNRYRKSHSIEWYSYLLTINQYKAICDYIWICDRPRLQGDALYFAALRGNVEETTHLLSNGANPRYMYDLPLKWAISGGHLEVAIVLILLGSDDLTWCNEELCEHTDGQPCTHKLAQYSKETICSLAFNYIVARRDPNDLKRTDWTTKWENLDFFYTNECRRFVFELVCAFAKMHNLRTVMLRAKYILLQNPFDIKRYDLNTFLNIHFVQRDLDLYKKLLKAGITSGVNNEKTIVEILHEEDTEKEKFKMGFTIKFAKEKQDDNAIEPDQPVKENPIKETDQPAKENPWLRRQETDQPVKENPFKEIETQTDNDLPISLNTVQIPDETYRTLVKLKNRLETVQMQRNKAFSIQTPNDQSWSKAEVLSQETRLKDEIYTFLENVKIFSEEMFQNNINTATNAIAKRWWIMQNEHRKTGKPFTTGSFDFTHPNMQPQSTITPPSSPQQQHPEFDPIVAFKSHLQSCQFIQVDYWKEQLKKCENNEPYHAPWKHATELQEAQLQHAIGNIQSKSWWKERVKHYMSIASIEKNDNREELYGSIASTGEKIALPIALNPQKTGQQKRKSEQLNEINVKKTKFDENNEKSMNLQTKEDFTGFSEPVRKHQPLIALPKTCPPPRMVEMLELRFKFVNSEKMENFIAKQCTDGKRYNIWIIINKVEDRPNAIDLLNSILRSFLAETLSYDLCSLYLLLEPQSHCTTRLWMKQITWMSEDATNPPTAPNALKDTYPMLVELEIKSSNSSRQSTPPPSETEAAPPIYEESREFETDFDIIRMPLDENGNSFYLAVLTCLENEELQPSDLKAVVLERVLEREDLLADLIFEWKDSGISVDGTSLSMQEIDQLIARTAATNTIVQIIATHFDIVIHIYSSNGKVKFVDSFPYGTVEGAEGIHLYYHTGKGHFDIIKQPSLLPTYEEQQEIEEEEKVPTMSEEKERIFCERLYEMKIRQKIWGKIPDGFVCESVPPDGDCFYHAFIKGLNLAITTKDLRKEVAEEILSNNDIYEDLVLEWTCEGVLDGSHQMTKELAAARTLTREWATNTIIHILSKKYNVYTKIHKYDRDTMKEPAPDSIKEIDGSYYRWNIQTFPYEWKYPDGKLPEMHGSVHMLMKHDSHFDHLRPHNDQLEPVSSTLLQTRRNSEPWSGAEILPVDKTSWTDDLVFRNQQPRDILCGGGDPFIPLDIVVPDKVKRSNSIEPEEAPPKKKRKDELGWSDHTGKTINFKPYDSGYVYKKVEHDEKTPSFITTEICVEDSPIALPIVASAIAPEKKSEPPIALQTVQQTVSAIAPEKKSEPPIALQTVQIPASAIAPEKKSEPPIALQTVQIPASAIAPETIAHRFGLTKQFGNDDTKKWLILASDKVHDLLQHMLPWKPELRNTKLSSKPEGWMIFSDITKEEAKTRWIYRKNHIWDESDHGNSVKWKYGMDKFIKWSDFEELLCGGFVYGDYVDVSA